MSDRKKFKKKLEDKIERFEKAAVSLSWKGSQYPRDFEAIEEDYRIEKKHLVDFVMKEYDLHVMKEKLKGVE